ncbi:MAG: formylglycine-generating enzyme family protein [Pirellulaceae bacterium]
MTQVALLLTLMFAADPTPDQLKLLQTFNSEFVAITPGEGKFPKSFTMGRDGGAASEQPPHRVTFSYNFSVAKYEVPQNLYEAVMGENPSRWKGPRNSVEMMSFDEAQQFCQKTTDLMRAAGLIEKDQVVRLPSEAEWEYFARAGTDTRYSFGDDLKQLDAHAWHTGNAAGNDPPVGALKANPWGLYDVHGYLGEWCLDHAHDNYEMAPGDGSAWTGGGDESRRIVRGGSWKDPAEALTSFHRLGLNADRGGSKGVGEPMDLRDDAIGLRCVLAPK